MPASLEDQAKEPVARCLIQDLMLPTIYFDAEWPVPGQHVDVLAIDRAGVGDVHVVEIRDKTADAFDAVAGLLKTPAHYRWIAYFAHTIKKTDRARLTAMPILSPPEGMGRVGVIEIVRMVDGEFGASIKVRAQRFWGSYYRMADEFTSRHPEADIQYR